ncbi:probable serine/threonine-protein kinase dyrk2 [Musca vetustissima]|uniref:probable serine/threonine-protein kinase dyrk2 n=1 Tax=Musca vetustissima TaxID=27455 RepID=UPI002AB61117|nr:probable serine/threonine-protein kinase dyrk2 [Musca vetustissima]
MTAENYHLKWDSHHSYLNSSVATLYKNEKYADVVLYSSNNTISTNNSMPTVGISAHKFILSSCSQFFSSIFETSPLSNNSNGSFHIVLPPDLSHRAIQILVQYMYMGEATVSNDILSEVLKGGEILKIRGLCRTTTPTTGNQITNRNSEPMQPAPSNGAATYNLIRMPLTNGPTSVRYLVEQQASTVSRGLSVSTLPKTSPVIVKSTKPINTLTVPSAVSIGKLATNPISVNKHVAIDPGEKCCYPVDAVTTLRDEAPPPPPTSICNEIGCNDCTRMTEHPTHMIISRDGQGDNNNGTQLCNTNCPDYIPPNVANECVDEAPYEQEIHLPPGEIPVEYNGGGVRNDNFKYSQQHLISTTSSAIVATTVQPLTTSTSKQVVLHETLAGPTGQYVSIKEEPSEWMTTTTGSAIHHGNGGLHSASSSSLHLTNKKTAAQNNEFKIQKIKTETLIQPQQPPVPSTTTSSLNNDTTTCQLMSTASNTNTTSIGGNQNTSAKDFDTYFSCDICKKVCEDKTSLLRHLESHAAPTPGTSSSSFSVPPAVCETSNAASSSTKSSYVPKKRRRISQQENASEHVCLQCDICNTRFETPQEWVRHMSTQHTEVELAIYNNKKDAEKNNQPTTSNHSNKKQASNVQQQPQPHNSQQRVQSLISGSTNSNLTNSTSVVCTPPSSSAAAAASSSPPTTSGGGSVVVTGGGGNVGGGINDTNATGYLRSTLSPA